MSWDFLIYVLVVAIKSSIIKEIMEIGIWFLFWCWYVWTEKEKRRKEVKGREMGVSKWVGGIRENVDI